MTIVGTSMIGFARTSGARPFHALNPRTGLQLDPPFASATSADVDRAAALAAAAFAESAKLSGARRGELLRRIAGNLEAGSEAIVARAHLETALPIGRLQGELMRTTGQLRMFATLVEGGSWVDARIAHGDPARKPPKTDLRSMLRPLGPVAVFGASNFPLAFSVAGGDTASALAAGCPVVVKAHPAHPGTSELAGAAIVDAVRELGLHEGTFSMLFDSGFEIGSELVMHAAIKAVGFTGSRRGGLALMEIAAKRPEPIPVYAEMGSVNPLFILPEALRTRGAEIAAGLHASVTLGVGQFCTNPGLVVTERGTAARAFIDDLEQRIAATAPGTMLTTGICNAYRTGVERLSSLSGAQRGISGAIATNAPDDAHSARAAVFVTDAETLLARRDLMDEVFGPSTIVVESSPEELLDIARALEGQLTVTIHAAAGELASHRELLEILETRAGRLVINGFPTGVEVSPAMVHGGPFPATSDGRSTSVGTRAIERFARPVCYQNFPDAVLPDELKQANPLGIRRFVDGEWR
jgi:2,5-dioxopentanoate dehydrogenase